MLPNPLPAARRDGCRPHRIVQQAADRIGECLRVAGRHEHPEAIVH